MATSVHSILLHYPIPILSLPLLRSVASHVSTCVRVNILVKLMSVFFLLFFCLLSPLLFLFVVVLCGCGFSHCCCCCWCCPLSPHPAARKPTTANIWSTSHGGHPLFPCPSFNLYPKSLTHFFIPSRSLLLVLSVFPNYHYFFPPLALFFFCLHPFPPDSTMQSWESIMPPPVSQRPFRGRAKGSACSQGKGQGWYLGVDGI